MCSSLLQITNHQPSYFDRISKWYTAITIVHTSLDNLHLNLPSPLSQIFSFSILLKFHHCLFHFINTYLLLPCLSITISTCLVPLFNFPSNHIFQTPQISLPVQLPTFFSPTLYFLKSYSSLSSSSSNGNPLAKMLTIFTIAPSPPRWFSIYYFGFIFNLHLCFCMLAKHKQRNWFKGVMRLWKKWRAQPDSSLCPSRGQPCMS